MKNILVLCLFVAMHAAAQDVGKVAGHIRDRATREPLPGVNVTVQGTRLGAVSGPDGTYFILNVPPGTFTVSASLVGYQQVTQRGVQMNVNRTTTLDFSLSETGVELGQEVVVTAERPDVMAEKTSTSEIVRAEDVQALPGIVNLTDVLSLQADVSDGHFRGGREGEELYTLAGMGIVNPLTNASAFMPIMSAVEEVEVITSGFSAQYGNAQSGVVNIAMKEGRSDRWRSRLEVKSRLPGYKHFGPSVFDESAQPYLQLLNSPVKWAGMDSSSQGGGRYYSGIAYGFDNRYRDTLQASQIAHALWQQARRDLNRKYNNLWDYSFDGNLGGPLSENARLFLAGRVSSTWQIIPTPEPDQRRQFMGNVAMDLGRGMALRFSGAYTQETATLLRGLGNANYTGFYSWLWDRVIGASRSTEENLQMGVRFVHTISPSTFYDIRLSRLATRYRDGAPVTDPLRYVSDDQNTAIWRYYNTPDQFRLASMDNDFRDQKTRTVSFDGAITSQVTQSHMLLAGAQMNFYAIDVNNRTSLSDPGSELDEIYSAKPFELGLYAQDKMEFEGMIANMGLRFDLYNQNVDYYTDQFSPFRVQINDSTYVTDPTRAGRARTPTIGRLQPRIGISFPVSVSTVFHMNYGSFLQRPSFERTAYMRFQRAGYNIIRLGNPRLLPQDTKSYDVGVTQALGDGFTVDLSGYYKDVQNLIELASFYDVQGNLFSTFMNRDYADIRGFHLTFSKRRGVITGSVRYNYSVATGKSSTPFNASPIFYEPRPGGSPQNVLPGPKDIALDFDRTHNLIVTVGFQSPDDWGPVLMDGCPLANLSLSVTSFARSGRPYTYDSGGLGVINNRRTPPEYNTDLKLSKRFPKLVGTGLTLSLEVFNLFNQKIYSYNTVFQSGSSTSSSGSNINRNIQVYETNRAALRYYDDFSPFLVDQTFLLYSNGPRSFQLGLVIDF